MPVLNAQGGVAQESREPSDIVAEVMRVTEHPSWELFVTQLNINARKYSDLVARPDFLEKFLAEYAMLRSCSMEEVLGFARGVVYGLKLAGSMPYALQKMIDDQRAGEDAEGEAATEEAATDLSEQGNEGQAGFRPAAHPTNLELEE